MAANVMVEVLKQIQQDLSDQKDYMRNLHVIHRNVNEKFNIMEGRISDLDKKLNTLSFMNLDKKIDQQQVTLERLEQHVIKNNKLLFGNDQADINIKKLSVMLYKPECKAKEKTSKTDDFMHTKDSDKIEECIAEVPAEMKDKYEEVESPVQEETARISSSYFNVEQINHLDLKQTMSEISEIKESIKDILTTRKTPVDVTSGLISKEENVQVSPTCFNPEQVIQLNGELKQIMTKMIEIKKLMEETIASKINPVDEATSPVRKQETVQLSLNYLSTDQISKLNGDLKRMKEKYQFTNSFPVIELIPGPTLDHPVMRKLTVGITLRPKTGIKLPWMQFTLGINGFKRSVVQDLLTEYPTLSLVNVVQEVLTSRNEWNDLMSKYDFNDNY